MGLADVATTLGAIGDRPQDDEAEQLRHRLLVYMGVLMSLGGLMWGSICAVFDLWGQASIPYGYAVLTVLNMGYFRASKNFGRVRANQVFISLLLPFLFQWVLGGFAQTGAVMLWAMLAIVGSMAFSSPGESARWLVLYSGFTIASGLLDHKVAELFPISVPPVAQTAFFVVNIVIISAIVFGLTIWVLAKREHAESALAALNENLEEEVSDRTQALGRALAQSSAVLDNMADGLVAVDGRGVIQAANPAFSSLFAGAAPRIGTHFRDALDPDLVPLIERSERASAQIKGDVALAGGRVGAAVVSPIEAAEDDEMGGTVVIVRDVTFEAEVDRMKTDFIATVSHELRTPLTSVLGFAKLTREKLEERVFPYVPGDDKKATRAVRHSREQIDIIVSESTRLTNLINDVLDISKMESGRMEWNMGPLDPAEVIAKSIDATAALFPADGSVRVVSDIEPGLPNVTGDEARLMQVMINFISNAAKFTSAGTVTIRGATVEGGVELSVTDTGDGIPEDQHAKVFERFRQVGDTLTNKPQGTGLGLPICKQIVEAHRGQIGVESSPGEGSRFFARLPTGMFSPRAQPDRIESTRPEVRVSIDSDSLLVVDDDANLRGMLREELEAAGFDVTLASSGSDALRQMRERRPSLVLLDVMMPDISGFDVLTLMRADTSLGDVPVVINSVVEPGAQRDVTVDAWFVKPSDVSRLVSTVEAVLRPTLAGKHVALCGDGLPEGVAARLRRRGYEVTSVESPERLPDVIRRTSAELVVCGGSAETLVAVEDILATIADAPQVVQLRRLGAGANWG